MSPIFKRRKAQLMNPLDTVIEQSEPEFPKIIEDYEPIISSQCDVKIEEPTQTLIESTTFAHLKTYPIVASWLKIFGWFPQPQLITKTIKAIAYSGYFEEYTLKFDQFSDKKLHQLDASVPLVKTLRMRNIRNFILDDPIHFIARTTQDICLDFFELAKKWVLQPSRNAIHSIRETRDEYIDLHNEPILRSQLNMVFKRINITLIKNANTYFPPNKSRNELPLSYLTLEHQSNEISHTIRIINLAFVRSKPVFKEKLASLIAFPSIMKFHLNQVYQSSKKDRGDGRIIIVIAFLETIRVLFNEAVGLISDTKLARSLGTITS